MRKIREILRLKWKSQLSNREIAKSCATARSTVAGCLERAANAALSWPLLEELDDEALDMLLYPPVVVSDAIRAPPDWSLVQNEMKKKSVTLALLWDEYKASQPDGYQYSQFCKLYREFTSRIDCCMRQCHVAGEKLFVDYCGQTVALTDPNTGALAQAQVFVAVMGASSYTYAEATLSQSLPNWLGSPVRAFTFFGGLPKIVVPDNLRSAVSKPCRYEPDINKSYSDLANHYNVAIIPARVRKPRDKAKAEAGVQLVQRWILAVLRNSTFFSLYELNYTIANLMANMIIAYAPFVVAFFAALILPAVFRNPNMFGKLSCVIFGGGFIFFLVAKIVNIRKGILISFGSKSMTNQQRLVYQVGYAQMIIGLIGIVFAVKIAHLSIH